ncbi:MAG: YigZ family protein [Flavobacteriaceae bacterium]
MKNTSDTYRTLLKLSEEVLHKDRKSKFIGQAFPISNEEEVKPIIESLRKKHHTANHVCYAWRLGVEKSQYRANDDGEPNNSAGMPIYGQIQSFGLTNVLITVTRVFGGTKLGVGGLINAYRTAAQMALHASILVDQIVMEQFEVFFNYEEMNKVMRLIKQQRLEISHQKMDMNCSLTLSIRKNDIEKTMSLFDGMKNVKIKQKSTD